MNRIAAEGGLAACLALCLCAAAIGDVTLVRDGKALASIVTPDQPTEAEAFAAGKLQHYLREMTGAELPILTEASAPAGGPLVCVGRTAAAGPALEALAPRKAVPETCVIAAVGQTVILSGIDDAGTTHAVYCLLEDLGCRWYFPAPWGWVIPGAATITVPAGERTQAPSFRLRAGIGQPRALTDANPDWQVNEWSRANHLGGWSWWGAGHSYQYLVDFGKFDEHPEWFAYYDGARHPTQLCTTNPQVRRMALETVMEVLARPGAPELICVSPCDGQGFCECEECSKLIPDDGKGGKATQDSIDRIVEFANYIADSIRDAYPGHYVTYYCDYHSVGTPKLVTPATNSVFWITQWAQDQLHPVTPESRLGRGLEDWSRFGNPIFLYTYWGSYGSFTYWPAATTIASDVPYFLSRGAMGVYSETHESWGCQHLNFILFSRLLWDSKTDAQAYIAEFCEKAFGPAAAQMREFYRILEDTIAAGPAQYHLHSEIMAALNPSVMSRLSECLRQARAALEQPGVDPDCLKRLDFVSAGHRVAELYYTANDLKAQFGATKDPALRQEIVERYKALLSLINEPQYAGRVVENWMFEPGLLQELRSVEGGTVFGVGKFAYEDGYERGGMVSLDAQNVSGFTHGVWGLNLLPGQTGSVLYEFGAKSGAFGEVALTRFVTCNRGSSTMHISTESAEGPWQQAAAAQSPDATQAPQVKTPVDLSSWVKGKARFWLRVTTTNELATDVVCALDQLRLEGEVAGQ